MNNIIEAAERFKKQMDAGSGEPPDNQGMEARVAKLEALAEKTGERLAAIERDVAVVRSNYATKEDIHKEAHTQTWRIIGAMITFGSLITGIVFYIARNVH